MKKLRLKFPQVSHYGFSVSHAKNRKRRGFKYNLHTTTVTINGKKRKVRVPTKILRMLKKAGVTAHYKPAAKEVKKEVKQVKKPMVKVMAKPVETIAPAKKTTKTTKVVATKAKTKAKSKAKPKTKAKAKAKK